MLLFLLETLNCFCQTSGMFSLFLLSSKPRFWHLKGWQHCQTHRGAEPIVRAECQCLPKNQPKPNNEGSAWTQQLLFAALTALSVTGVLGQGRGGDWWGIPEDFQGAPSELSTIQDAWEKPQTQLAARGRPLSPIPAFPKPQVTQHWVPRAPEEGAEGQDTSRGCLIRVWKEEGGKHRTWWLPPSLLPGQCVPLSHNWFLPSGTSLLSPRVSAFPHPTPLSHRPCLLYNTLQLFMCKAAVIPRPFRVNIPGNNKSLLCTLEYAKRWLVGISAGQKNNKFSLIFNYLWYTL